MTKKQRIAINVQGNRSWIGGSQYTKNLVFALSQLPNEVRNQYEIVLISNKSEFQAFKDLELYVDRIFFREIDFKRFTIINRIKWKFLRIFTRQSDPRLNEFMSREKIDFLYPYFSRDSRLRNYHSAAWIFDFQHKYLPEFFSKEEIQKRDQHFANIAQFAKTIIFSSYTAKQDFYKFFPGSTAKTEVLPFKSFSPLEWYKPHPKEVQEKYHLPGRFFLISNQFWQHKNHLVVLEALKQLKNHSIKPIIVCTGHLYDYRNPEYIDRVLETIHCSGLTRQVYLLGLIKRLDQIQLMRRALAVIQPSLFEGWSTVIEDARCLGKPVIMSDLEVNLEQNPPNSKVFRRNSAKSLAPIMAKWWEQLQPGPDLEQEKIARDNNLVAVQEFGSHFFKISQNI